MGNELLLYMGAGIFAGLFVALYFSTFKRYLTGKIQIKLPKKIYTYGETIEGTFILHTKKDIQGEDLKVYLTAHQRQSGYGPNGGKTTRQIESARLTQDIESGTMYKAGGKKDYKIHIKIPEMQELFSEQDAPIAGKGRPSKLSRHTLIRSKRHNYTWELRVKLQGKGVKLSSSRYVFVSQ